MFQAGVQCAVDLAENGSTNGFGPTTEMLLVWVKLNDSAPFYADGWPSGHGLLSELQAYFTRKLFSANGSTEQELGGAAGNTYRAVA